MKRKLSVIFILAAAIACIAAFTACVDNVAYPSDLYGEWYLAGNYDESADEADRDMSITDYDRGFTLCDNANGDPWAYVMFGGVAGTEESCYALYDLSVENTITLKQNDRWGKTLYTLDVLGENLISVVLPAENDEGNVINVTYYFTRAEV